MGHGQLDQSGVNVVFLLIRWGFPRVVMAFLGSYKWSPRCVRVVEAVKLSCYSFLLILTWLHVLSTVTLKIYTVYIFNCIIMSKCKEEVLLITWPPKCQCFCLKASEGLVLCNSWKKTNDLNSKLISFLLWVHVILTLKCQVHLCVFLI